MKENTIKAALAAALGALCAYGIQLLVPVLVLLIMEPHMSGILLTTAIVGTGGDGFATVNLSTMGSVAAAAAGVDNDEVKTVCL